MLGFRVWDLDIQKMYYVDDDYYAHNKHFFCIAMDGKLSYPNLVHPNMIYDNESEIELETCISTYIPMQSTGIKDFRGREIFEGDMLFLYRSDGSNEYYYVESLIDFHQYLGREQDLIQKISCDGNVYEQPSLIERLDEVVKK